MIARLMLHTISDSPGGSDNVVGETTDQCDD
jgi:hypothetical protein